MTPKARLILRRLSLPLLGGALALFIVIQYALPPLVSRFDPQTVATTESPPPPIPLTADHQRAQVSIVGPRDSSEAIRPTAALSKPVRSEPASTPSPPRPSRVAVGQTVGQTDQFGKDMLERITRGLADVNEQVRLETLQTASIAAIDPGPGVLESVFRFDPSARVRASALSLLVSPTGDDGHISEAAAGLLREALLDPDPEVAEFARDLAAAAQEVADAMERSPLDTQAMHSQP